MIRLHKINNVLFKVFNIASQLFYAVTNGHIYRALSNSTNILKGNFKRKKHNSCTKNTITSTVNEASTEKL